MERLTRVAALRPLSAKEIGPSRLGIGFEKLDRFAFDPEPAYDQVAELGVHYVRLQSGWQRTEREKGVYDFKWLDDIVDHFLARGQEPWLCLCYGNDLYTPLAKQHYGAVGCPPIHTEEERAAWKNYVTAVVTRYRGKIRWYEVWNEPDGQHCWKEGVNPVDLSAFTVATANAVHAADPDAKVIAGVLCYIRMPFFKTMFDCGVADAVDAVSFHRYNADELSALAEIRALRALIDRYDPSVEIIQGESGTQSDSRGAGALRGGAWTELKQAKYTLRHRLLDLASEVTFTSHFTALDMVEALHGDPGNKQSWLDYGYFGLLHADFDEDGRACGTYTPKLGYRAMQHLTAVFRADVKAADLPVVRRVTDSPRIFARDDASPRTVMLGFRSENGAEALAYWRAADLMTETFEGTITFELPEEARKLRLIDLMDGAVYDIPDSMLTRTDKGVVSIDHLPLTDSPLLLTFGDFVRPDALL